MDTVKARCKRLGSQFPSEVNRHEDSMSVGPRHGWVEMYSPGRHPGLFLFARRDREPASRGGALPLPTEAAPKPAENPLTRIRSIGRDLRSHIEMMASLLVSDCEIKYFLPSIWETALPGKETQVTSDFSVMVAAIR
jgi:hypothetical protein